MAACSVLSMLCASLLRTYGVCYRTTPRQGQIPKPRGHAIMVPRGGRKTAATSLLHTWDKSYDHPDWHPLLYPAAISGALMQRATYGRSSHLTLGAHFNRTEMEAAIWITLVFLPPPPGATVDITSGTPYSSSSVGNMKKTNTDSHAARERTCPDLYN